MEERRFDAWTRALGAATSRRQVLKGVLGGVLAAVVGRSVEPAVVDAAPGSGCSVRACERKVSQFFTTCVEGCAVSGALRRTRDPRIKAYCRSNCYLASKALSEQCQHNGGCFGNDGTCCTDQCVDLDTDPNNCGGCGHACPEGHACVDGQCQCEDDQAYCGNQCVYTQTDNNNCGACGHTCTGCETCLGGECQPLNCGSGQVCCQHLCIPACQGGPPDPNTCLCDVCDGQANGLSCGPEQVCCNQHCMSEACPDGKKFDLNSCACQCTPITCPDGQTQDPITCQCVSICLSAPVGTSCGSNMECCGQQCVSTQCSFGREFSIDTCQCECTPIECPSGESQDPLTCQCTSKCAGVKCGTCQTCDPNSGTCVNADNNSDCGGGNVCCDGVCQADCTCTGVSCSNGDCCADDSNYACCDDGCCPQVTLPDHSKGAYCLAPGTQTPPSSFATGVTWGGCCQPDQLMKLSNIDDDTGLCNCVAGTQYDSFCDGNMPATYLGLTACSCGSWLT